MQKHHHHVKENKNNNIARINKMRQKVSIIILKSMIKEKLMKKNQAKEKPIADLNRKKKTTMKIYKIMINLIHIKDSGVIIVNRYQ